MSEYKTIVPITPNILHLIDFSKKSDMSHKHAAMIYKGNQKILSYGYNHTRGCIFGKPIYGLHAEVDAILQLLKNVSLYQYVTLNYGCCFTLSLPPKEKKKLRGLTMIVIRNNMENSKPCKHCLEFIKSVGIRKIIYSDGGNYEWMRMEDVRYMETDWISHGDQIMIRKFYSN